MTIAELINKQMDVIASFQKTAIETGDGETVKDLAVAIDTLKILKDIEHPRIDSARAIVISTETSDDLDSQLRQIVQEELTKLISQGMHNSLSNML